MRMMTLFFAAFTLSGCIATAPVSIAWRSNASQQYATTDAKNDKAADRNMVNADRTSEMQAAVTTGEGSANTAAQSLAKGGESR